MKFKKVVNVIIGIIIFSIIGDYSYQEKQSAYNIITPLLLFTVLIAPILVYLFYNLFVKKKRTNKQKEVILKEIRAKKAEFIQLENSVNSIMGYKDKINL